MASVTMDKKGRVVIPKSLRQAVGAAEGDTFFIREVDGVLQLARAADPFDGLAEHAIQEYRAGRTRSIRDIAGEEGVDLDAPGDISG